MIKQYERGDQKISPLIGPYEIVAVDKVFSTIKIGCKLQKVQGGSNMTGTDLCVNKPHCAAAVRP